MVLVLDAVLMMELHYYLLQQLLQLLKVHVHACMSILIITNYMYIGSLSSVVNLIAVQQQDRCRHSIFIKWNPPYLFPGLSVSYTVYINGEMIQDDISTTNYTYYPMELTNTTYEITVLAFSDLVIGNTSTIETNFIVGKPRAHAQCI